MSTTLAPPVDVTTPGRTDRRPGLAILVASVVVVGTVATILAVGYVPLPPMPPLAVQPDPSVPGTVAFVHGDWEEACVAIVPAGGGDPVDLRCAPVIPEALAWTTDGDLAISAWGDGVRPFEARTVTVVDAATGAELQWVEGVTPVMWAADRHVRADGARLAVTAPEEGVTVLVGRYTDGSTTEIARLAGPRDYDIASAQWSPDGEWVLALDTRGRLFVVAADGDPGPRLVAETGGRDVLWALPAWWIDGQPSQRVDVASLELERELAP